MVHCGYYDKSVSGGLFEGHTNFFVVAETIAEAKSKAKSKPEFKRLKMHVDGIQEVVAVDGFKLDLKEDKKLQGATLIRRQKYGSTKAEVLEFKS